MTNKPTRTPPRIHPRCRCQPQLVTATPCRGDGMPIVCEADLANEGRFNAAADAVYSLLRDGPEIARATLRRANDNCGSSEDLRKDAAFCAACAAEMRDGPLKEYLGRIAAAMMEYADAWDILDG